MKSFYKQLIENNRKWVSEKLDLDKDYFNKLASGQKPPLLWIGCADSRVPANEITGTQAGEVFVHRNIANMVIHTDMNMLSVLDYAVNVLKVKHVIVCGHYGCGGVMAAMQHEQFGLIDNWVRHIRDVYRHNEAKIDCHQDPTAKANALVEINVKAQVYNLSSTSIVQNAWHNNQEIAVHGWVYDIRNGLVQDLNVSMYSADEVDQIYKMSIKP